MEKVNMELVKLCRKKNSRAICFFAVNLGGFILLQLLLGLKGLVLGGLQSLTGWGLFGFLNSASTFLLTWLGFAAFALADRYVSFRSNAPWYKALLMLLVRLAFNLLCAIVSLVVYGLLNNLLHALFYDVFDMSWRETENLMNGIVGVENFVGGVLGTALWLGIVFVAERYLLYAKTMDTNALAMAIRGEQPAEAPEAPAAAPAAPVAETVVPAAPVSRRELPEVPVLDTVIPETAPVEEDPVPQLVVEPEEDEPSAEA